MALHAHGREGGREGGHGAGSVCTAVSDSPRPAPTTHGTAATLTKCQKQQLTEVGHHDWLSGKGKGEGASLS